MKKLSETRRIWLLQHQHAEWRSRLRQKGRSLRKRSNAKRIRVTLDTKNGRFVAWAAQRKPMPRVVCLDRNYEECLGRIGDLSQNIRREVRKHQSNSKRRVNKKHHFKSFLDFATIEECTPAAALIIAAEYDRGKAFMPIDLALFNLDQWKPNIVDMFDQIGFFDLLKISRPDKKILQHPTQRVVPFSTAETVGNAEAGQLIRTLAHMIAGADPEGLINEETRVTRMRLFAALVEATENTRRHAYPAGFGRGENIVRRWWMTGSFDSAQKRVTLIVYDQGVTIPGSLPLWPKFNAVQRAYHRFLRTPMPSPTDTQSDALLLRMAMAVPGSSTGLPWRGKGFPAFKEVINACSNGRLRIISRCGEFMLEKGRRPNAQQLRTPLDGTLVEWDLWL